MQTPPPPHLLKDILRLLDAAPPAAILRSLGDALLTTPYGDAIPPTFGWRVFTSVRRNSFPAAARISLYLRHLLAADPGGLCLLLRPLVEGAPESRPVLRVLAQRIPTEHWATGRYEELRDLMDPPSETPDLRRPG